MNAGIDVLLVGGGLANSLIAWRLAKTRPDIRFLILEQGPTLGGNHTWSFHEADLDPQQRHWIEPLICYRWPGYRVEFPQRSRRLDGGYCSILSERLAEIVGSEVGDRVRYGTAVSAVTPTSVTLADGTVLQSRAVIDGRGVGDDDSLALGYQAFVGQELQLREPHGLTIPLIMDARVSQGDGYRFVYVLPFGADRMLVEDTHYIDDARGLNAEDGRAAIAAYAQRQGWSVEAIRREEQGVLPITLAGAFDDFWQGAGNVPRSGLRAGLFHATTGYSLPHAVRLADLVASLPVLDAGPLFQRIRSFARHDWRRQAYFRLLNRMLFLAGEPRARWQVMQRFYGLSEPLIQRFYAGRLTLADQARILCGKPPVPVGEAWRAMHLTDPKRIRTST